LLRLSMQMYTSIYTTNTADAQT